MKLSHVSDIVRLSPGDAMRKILVIDDDPSICELVVNSLGGRGGAEIEVAIERFSFALAHLTRSCSLFESMIHRSGDSTYTDHALDGRDAASKLQAGGFDLVLIEASLSGLAGIHLAQIAANVNTAALLMSGHPQINADLERFGFPYLEKP